MPFVAKKSHLFERKKKNWKNPVNNSNLTEENKIATQKQTRFFFFRFLELFLFAMENHFKNLLQIFLNTTESKSLILLANWNRICKFCLFANIFWKKKNNTKYRHTYAIWIVIMLDSSFKWKKQENQNKNTK